MREINVGKIREAVAELCLKANFELRKDILRALNAALKKETNDRARGILTTIVENARIARARKLAICQDTGMVFVSLELGQDVRLTGGDLAKAINNGVKDAYCRGYLRTSVVADPLVRKNTQTNTPAIIVTEIVPGSRVKITVSPKGFGSENKSRIHMFRPTASARQIRDFVLDVVRGAGADACPPLILGIGIGGTFGTAALLAQKALLRPIDRRNPAGGYAKLEKELMKRINALGMGPMALGGRTTALGVNILAHPTHIAGLPVAVNVGCHATRSASKVI